MARHQVAASEIEPLEARQPLAEACLDMLERMGEGRTVRLAMAMAVEALDAVRKLRRHIRGQNSEAAAACARVVEVDLDLRIFGIDAQSAAYLVRCGLGHVAETVVLRQRIECYVAAACRYLGKLGLGICGRVGVGERAELLGRKARLIERAGGGGVDVFTEYGEGAPQSEGLECKDRLAAGTAARCRV